MDELRALLDQTAKLAADFYDTLDERAVYPRADTAELRVGTPVSPLDTVIASIR